MSITEPNSPNAMTGDNSKQFLYDHLTNAVQFACKQDQITWTIFGVFWPANGILLVALFTTGSLPEPVVGIIISITGLFFSTVWTSIQYRSLAHLEYYETIIHRLEKDYIPLPKEIILSGRLNAELFKEKMGRIPRVRPLMRVYGIISSLIWLIASFYFIYLCIAL